MRVQPILYSTAGLSLASQVAAYSAIYLFEIPAFNDARGCVQGCAITYSNYGISRFGCNDNAGVATCLCSNNVEQSSYISTWYSSCALSSCSDEPDASTAVQIWADYCQANINANSPLSVPATTTTAPSAAGSSPGASPAGSTTTPTPTGTGTGDGNGDGSGSGSGNGNGASGNNNGDTTTNNYGAGAILKPESLLVPGYVLAALLSLAFLL